MNSRGWNDSEDMRLIAQKLGEEENWRSDEEYELKKTVEKIEKPPSILGDTSNSGQVHEIRSASGLQSPIYVPLQPPSILGDTSNSGQSSDVMADLLKKYKDYDPKYYVVTGLWKEQENWSSDEEEDEICLSIFSKCEIYEATNNLSDSLKIGEGGYGPVYKGKIDNTKVAIKILSNTSEHGMEAFHRELAALNGVRHVNLVNLKGSCSELGALVYEYVPNGSLEDCLMKRSAKLTWEIRTRIVYEICTTLMFLHANQPDPLVHGDLKPHNVLLDANFKTKLTDFGLCRFLTQAENSGKFHKTKTAFGTTGYIDPDFLELGIVRPAIDVYSFGKTIIRILTNERPGEISRKVHEARKTKSLMTIVDPAVRGWPEEIVELLAIFALRCCKYHRYKPKFMRMFYTDLQRKVDPLVFDNPNACVVI